MLPQVPPQRRRHHPHRFAQPSAHAQEADLQRQSESERRRAPLLDHPPLVPGKREERLNLEAAQIARQRPPPQPRRLSVVHVLALPRRAPPQPTGKGEQQPIDSARKSRFCLQNYREILPGLLAPKSRGPPGRAPPTAVHRACRRARDAHARRARRHGGTVETLRGCQGWSSPEEIACS